MLLINLDKNSSTPLYRQVEMAIIDKIEQSVLEVGDRLPSTRELSEKLCVHRTTITKAYDELWAAGYIESRPGAYTCVRDRKLKGSISDSKSEIINWDRYKDIVPDCEEASNVHYNHKINMRSLSPDSRIMPLDEFRKSANNIINKIGSNALTYGDGLGYKPLRQEICKHMSLHGISADIDEVLITTGMQNGLDLLCKLLISKGDKIVVESPTYSTGLNLFKYYGADFIEVPMTESGMDLDVLEKLLYREKPKFIYTIPNFHNPTGITTEYSHRERLLKICQDYKTPLLEDGFEEEMKYFGKAILPVKSMDNSDVVIYMGTFSKILFPGLRTGWIVANSSLVNTLSKIKKVSVISGNVFDQATISEFIKCGYFEKQVKRLHKVYKRRMSLAIKMAEQYLDFDNVQFTKPVGGYTMFVSVDNPGVSEKEIVEKLEKTGVLVSAGYKYYAYKNNKCGFRISIAHTDESEIEEGFIKINKVLKGFI